MVNQNAAGNKLDYHLRRQVDYRVRLRPRGDHAYLDGTVDVTVSNRATARGLPGTGVGPAHRDHQGGQGGENRSLVTVYSPLTFDHATLNGVPVILEASRQLGGNAYSTITSIPPAGVSVMRLHLQGEVRLEDGGWHALELVRQPTMAPDEVRVTVEVPEGWRIAETRGLPKENEGQAKGEVKLDRDHTFRMRLERS